MIFWAKQNIFHLSLNLINLPQHNEDKTSQVEDDCDADVDEDLLLDSTLKIQF